MVVKKKNKKTKQTKQKQTNKKHTQSQKCLFSPTTQLSSLFFSTRRTGHRHFVLWRFIFIVAAVPRIPPIFECLWHEFASNLMRLEMPQAKKFQPVVIEIHSPRIALCQYRQTILISPICSIKNQSICRRITIFWGGSNEDGWWGESSCKGSKINMDNRAE